MQITQRISPAVLAAATAMLQTFVPELSPQGLVEALKTCESGKPSNIIASKPLTRKQAASMLSVSVNTLNRYMRDGIIRRVKIGPRIVRIDPQSIMALMNSGNDEV